MSAKPTRIRPRAELSASERSLKTKRFADTIPEPRDAAQHAIKRRARSTDVAKAQ
jgi:hypothetical protein